MKKEKVARVCSTWVSHFENAFISTILVLAIEHRGMNGINVTRMNRRIDYNAKRAAFHSGMKTIGGLQY